MSNSYSIFIGVDVCFSSMHIYFFDSNGHYLDSSSSSNPPLTPGHLTTLLTEKLTSIENFCVVDYILVAIPGDFINNKGPVISLEKWPGWNNVPLVRWLEIRLKKSVYIVKKGCFLNLKDPSRFFLNFKSIYPHQICDTV